jgi:hypothetical protein
LAGIKQLMGLMQQPVASKMAQQAAPKAAAGDGLQNFRQLLKNGGIKSDLNKPALPHTASRGWVG